MRMLHHHLSPPLCNGSLSQKYLGCLGSSPLLCSLTFIPIVHCLPPLLLCLHATFPIDFKYLAPPAVSFFGQKYLIPDVIHGEITVSL